MFTEPRAVDSKKIIHHTSNTYVPVSETIYNSPHRAFVEPSNFIANSNSVVIASYEHSVSAQYNSTRVHRCGTLFCCPIGFLINESWNEFSYIVHTRYADAESIFSVNCDRVGWNVCRINVVEFEKSEAIAPAGCGSRFSRFAVCARGNKSVSPAVTNRCYYAKIAIPSRARPNEQWISELCVSKEKKNRSERLFSTLCPFSERANEFRSVRTASGRVVVADKRNEIISAGKNKGLTDYRTVLIAYT